MKKEKYILVLCIILFLILYAMSICCTNYVKKNLSSVSARYDTESVSPMIIQNALQNLQNNSTADNPKITLWNRKKKESIQNKITGLKLDTNVIEVNGNMAQIIPMKFIEGYYVFQDDEKGCVLDSKTAYHLFGTTKAVNNIVEWNGKEYIVRGVVKADDTMMLIQISDKDYLYSNVEAVYQDKVDRNNADNESQQLKNLFAENGLKEPDTIIDGVLNSWKLYIIFQIPIWMIGLEVAILLIRNTYQLRNSQILCIISCIGTVLLVFVIIKITKFYIHIPSQFIPTKWSDFDFYINKYKEIQQHNIDNHNGKLMPKDILRNNSTYKCILIAILNILLLIFTRIKFIKTTNG